ncbi:prolipoprotein diacylglyceryl transferase [soil metagenome]
MNTQYILHVVFEYGAYTIGTQLFLLARKRSRDVYTTEQRIRIFLGAAIGALVGSHLLGLLERPDLITSAVGMGLQFVAQKTIVGGLLGGLIGVEIAKKVHGYTSSSGDLMVFPLIVAMIVGRIGCHLGGIEDGTYGLATSLPWGVDVGDGVLRHPTNLYEILFLIVLGIALWSSTRVRTLPDGRLFQVFMTCYLVFRLCIEFIKPSFVVVAGCSSIQLACVCGLLYYFFEFRK